MPYDDTEYRSDLLRQYPADSHARPYAVIADFNGGGRRGVVFDGQSPMRLGRVVLLSSRTAFRALLLVDQARDTRAPRSSKATGQRTVYLSYVKPD